jgi:DNA-binding transcriptional regulator YhcF (GntR family)
LADWDLSTRKANEAYIRRVIKPALGHLQVRKIRGPLLDLLYIQLRRCSDPACTGKQFVEHRNVPTLSVVSTSRRPAWQQVADTLRDAVDSGMLRADDPLPSVQEMSAVQGVRVATLQHALAVLAEEGLVVLRQGRTAVVAGDVVGDRRARAARGRDHDCKRAGCRPHVCRPLTAKTIRNIHSILSGAFSTAERWAWISRGTCGLNPIRCSRYQVPPQRVADAEQPADQRRDPLQRPPLVLGPAMHGRTRIQLAAQPGQLRRAQPAPPRPDPGGQRRGAPGRQHRRH